MSTLVSLSTLAQGVAVCVALIIGIVQVTQVRNSRQFDALNQLFKEFHSAEAIALRELVFSASHESISTDVDLQQACRQNCEFFERISFMSRHGMLRERHLLQMYSGVIILSFQALAPYITWRRSQPYLSNYAGNFESVARRAQRFRRRGKF